MNSFSAGSSFGWIIAGVIVILALLLMVGAVRLSVDFAKELSYVKEEIRRTIGIEQRYWRRRERRLWLSLFLLTRY